MINEIVRTNLMTRKGYSPYCGGSCREMPRASFAEGYLLESGAINDDEE